MNYYASGKLLLFGEYLVLKGAECLAIPLKYGQSLQVEKTNENYFSWTSKVNEEIWFTARFSKELEIIEASDAAKTWILIELLTYLKSGNATLFQSGLNFKTQADFPLEWGFGSSSTLISLLAQWSGLNPYSLLENSFGGSGYDVACATVNTPVLYNADAYQTTPVALSPQITSKLLFVYNGKKQNTKEEVQKFKALKIATSQIQKMNQLVLQAARSTQIESFEVSMNESEKLLAGILSLAPIKEEKFKYYPFAIKSLGAWGGDFFMATYRDEKAARKYFNELGYAIQFNYNELIKE